MNYWYIWYELYEDGELIPNSKGRYVTGYKHKANAVRRAKQMWDKDLYNPHSDTYIHREWIVSQTNPWEDVYVFETRAEANNAINFIWLMTRRYGFVTRSDLRDYLGDPSDSFIDSQFGWSENTLRSSLIVPRRSGPSIFLLELPKAVPIV